MLQRWEASRSENDGVGARLRWRWGWDRGPRVADHLRRVVIGESEKN